MRGTSVSTFFWESLVEVAEIPFQLGDIAHRVRVTVLVSNGAATRSSFEVGLERRRQPISEECAAFAGGGNESLCSSSEEKWKQGFCRNLEPTVRRLVAKDRGARMQLTACELATLA